MTDRRASIHYTSSSGPISHHYPVYPSAGSSYPSAAYGAPTSASQYSDYDLQPSGNIPSAYYATPRTAAAHAQNMAGSPPAHASMSAYYGSYPQTQSMPIPVPRQQYSTHSPAAMSAYGHAYAPASPHAGGSPESPVSPLAQYAYSPSSIDAANAGQYPASPQRPYACDLCVLSFSRQHDLKRHRDTHSGLSRSSTPTCSSANMIGFAGEKPYNCDGGCGKNFTRKDALKRHQVSLLHSCSSPQLVLTLKVARQTLRIRLRAVITPRLQGLRHLPYIISEQCSGARPLSGLRLAHDMHYECKITTIPWKIPCHPRNSCIMSASIMCSLY
jgi:uncharacterized Zn-finger protein